MKRKSWNHSFQKKGEASVAADSQSCESHGPTWEQGGGQRKGGSLEDVPWLLRALPGGGSEWQAWCTAFGC